MTAPFYKQIYHKLRQSLAKIWIRNKRAVKIGITGSQGKTHTTLLIESILRQSGETVVTDVNLDSEFNVPITALKVRSSTKYAVFEMGIDGFGQMGQYLNIVRPDIAVVTGVCAVHTDDDHLKSIENVVIEKGKLVEAVKPGGYAILNYDDKRVRGMQELTDSQIITYGTDDNAMIKLSNCRVGIDGTRFELKISCNQKKADLKIESKLIGRHQMYNIAAAYAVCCICGISDEDFVQRIKEFEPLQGRLNLEDGPLGTLILNDGLRANPDSMAAGLRALSDIAYSDGRKVAVLNEMGELSDPEAEHRKIGRLIAELDVDFVVCVGPLQKFTADEAKSAGMKPDNVAWVDNVINAAQFLRGWLRKGDLLYIKGSRLRHSERILMILEGEKLACDVTSCHFYHDCKDCELKNVSGGKSTR
ncbi:hypothetical protein GF357_04320 [Candidatus Dojkabacteria bacterium]|nr:hypothetical protein [Candidatus Dojkabacteria bacterium]